MEIFLVEQIEWQGPATTSRPSETGLIRRPLREMLDSVATVVRTGKTACERRLALIIAQHAIEPDLLDGIPLQSSRARYTRHLLENGDRHCVVAIVWLPGQMSPVHAHRTWCALSVHRGSLTETIFRRDDQGLRLVRSRQLHEGGMSHAPAGGGIHRIANLGTEAAISLHAYGVPYDRLGHDVNDVRSE